MPFASQILSRMAVGTKLRNMLETYEKPSNITIFSKFCFFFVKNPNFRLFSGFVIKEIVAKTPNI